jgi:transposase
LGEGIQPEHLNDDRLGRVLDKLYDAGLTEIFIRVALLAAGKFGVKMDSFHLDSSSFHVHGEYETGALDEASAESGLITITYGYSREHRPDLKQFILDLMCSGDGDIPLYLRVADGNEVDSAMFGTIITDFQKQWQIDALFVADAALYTEENLQMMLSLRWVSRVPATPWINLCKTGQPYIFCPHLISLVEVAARGFCSLSYNSSSNQTPLLQRLPSFAYFL